MFKLSQCIKTDSALAQLTQHSQGILKAQKAWENVVPNGLAPYSQAGDVQHKQLTIYCFNGAVAAKIKMLLPTLLMQLQKQGLEVTSIRVVVQVKSFAQALKKPHRIISEHGASTLNKMADDMSGSALGDSLKRLASRKQSTPL